MKPKLLKPANKPRFVIDVNISLGNLKVRFGGFANFISSIDLIKSASAKDIEIIKKSSDRDYHIITHNTQDFDQAPVKLPNLKIGIICVNIYEENYLDKFGVLLREFKKHQRFYNKLIYLGNEIKIISYSELRKSGD